MSRIFHIQFHRSQFFQKHFWMNDIKNDFFWFYLKIFQKFFHDHVQHVFVSWFFLSSVICIVYSFLMKCTNFCSVIIRRRNFLLKKNFCSKKKSNWQSFRNFIETLMNEIHIHYFVYIIDSRTLICRSRLYSTCFLIFDSISKINWRKRQNKTVVIVMKKSVSSQINERQIHLTFSHNWFISFLIVVENDCFCFKNKNYIKKNIESTNNHMIDVKINSSNQFAKNRFEQYWKNQS